MIFCCCCWWCNDVKGRASEKNKSEQVFFPLRNAVPCRAKRSKIIISFACMTGKKNSDAASKCKIMVNKLRCALWTTLVRYSFSFSLFLTR